MASINQLFQNFMRLVGLNYYNKTESDNRYLSKDSVFDGVTVDDALDENSNNPVKNKIIYEEIDDITDAIMWILENTEDINELKQRVGILENKIEDKE